MPPTQAETYHCPYCNHLYLAIPLAYAALPTHDPCRGVPDHLPQPTIPSLPDISPWDYRTERICTHCEQGKHHECTDALCSCPMSTEDGPCLFSQDKAKRLADGTRPDHIHY